MVQVNHADKIIHAKVVYYGPPVGGKTTSLQAIHRLTDPERRRPLISMNTAQDRTLFFDLLPCTVSNVLGYTLQMKLYTVPGQVQYNATRRVVLGGADALIFVADSLKSKAKENLDSLANLKENLQANGMSPTTLPMVIQHNKRDLDGLLSLEELERALNERRVPSFPTVATSGEGVMEAFIEVVKRMLLSFADRFGSAGAAFDAAKAAEEFERQFTRYRVKPGEAPPAARTAAAPRPAGGPPGGGPAPRKPARGASGRMVYGGYDEPDGAGEIFREEAIGGEEPLATRAGLHRPVLKVEDQLRESVRSNLELSEQYQDLLAARDQLKQRVNELVGLSRIGRLISSSLEMESLLGKVLELGVGSVGGTGGSLLTLNPEGGQLEERWLHGLDHDPLNAIFIPGLGTVAWQLAQRRQPLVYSNLRDDLFFGEEHAACRDIQSLISVPLEHGAAHRGILNVYSTDPDVVFDRQHLNFLGALASQAAISLENCILYEELKGERASLQEKVDERTRELREALASLRKADAAKDRFLSTISHEMKTPLTSIISYTDLLLSFRDEPPESRQEFLRIIREEAEKLHGMTARILQFAELEAERNPAEREPVPVDQVLIDVARGLKTRLRAREQKLSIRICKPIRPVSGDRQRLYTVFYNLIENASKFSASGTAVQVEARTLRDEAEVQAYGVPGGDNGMSPPLVRVSVRDQGKGIDPQDQQRIFDRFEQGGEILTSKPDGLGLGLPIARRIVQDHGGRILLLSNPGQGSEFTVLLQAAAG